MNFKLQCQQFIELVKADDVKMDAEDRGARALMFAQDVLGKFSQLDPARKEMYEKHLEDILVVLAWANPEASPNRHYLEQERRDQLADIMNSAVLGMTKQGKQKHTNLYSFEVPLPDTKHILSS